jgi:hypothetical protein
MTVLVPISLFGWIPAVILIFALRPPRQAALLSFLIAWLFLPVAAYSFQGAPDLTKMSATCVGVLIATLIFDTPRLSGFRPHWVDLPMIVWCAVPFASSVSNNLTMYDGFSESLRQTINWGLPYLIGRLYLSDCISLRQLAMFIIAGGAIYLPLCLYEIKMSPQLHAFVYGFVPAGWGHVKRFGGWRPVVFMDSGLMLGMWMAAASLLGVWMWSGRSLGRVFWRIPTTSLLVLLVVTTILCKSLLAITLFGVGIIVLYASRQLQSAAPLALLVAVPILYMGARAGLGWSGGELVSIASMAGEERTESLQVRLRNEDILGEKALERPWVGWGGWGRSRPTGKKTITDGLWIIALGQNGLVGLAAITAVQLLPAILLIRKVPVAHWCAPVWAPAVGLAALLALYAVDNLLNAMVNPIYLLAVGGLNGAMASWRSPESARMPSPLLHARGHT